MALRLVLLLVLVAVVCQAQEEGGNPRQRLRALFNRRRAEGQTGDSNVSDGAEGRSPLRLRRIRPRRPIAAEKNEDNVEEEEEGQIIGVSSSVSTSSSSEVRRRPLIRTPVREEEVSQDVVDSKESGEELNEDEVLDAKAKLTAREKARLRFKKLRSGNRDEKDELLDRLLNNVNIQQTSGGRRRFRPSVDRSKLRKKTESAFNPARPASKFRLRLRRPEATTEVQTTVTEEPVTVISVSAVTSRSETEARETFAPEAREQGDERRTTVAGTTGGSQFTGVPITTERSFLALRTTQQEERRTTLQEVVTEAATVRRTTEAPTTKRPKKFDFSRSRLRPKLRTSPTTTTTEAPATTTSQPLRTTVLEERRSTFVPTTFAPTPQPFQIRVEESVFDSFPKINQGASSSADVLKKLQLIASSDKKPSLPQRRPQPITLRPAFTFPKPKEVPVIIEEELELENEIIDTNPFQFVPKEVRPAFVGVTTSVKIPKKLESVVLKEVAREPIVFEVEETVRSVEQPKRPQVEISRPAASVVRRPASSERRPASTGRRVNHLAQIPVRRLNQSQRRPQPQQSLLQPEQIPAFNQIQPEPIKPIVFTPRNFDLPKFFTEPFTFQATFNRAPGPGSYAYSVGL